MPTVLAPPPARGKRYFPSGTVRGDPREAGARQLPPYPAVSAARIGSASPHPHGTASAAPPIRYLSGRRLVALKHGEASIAMPASG